MSIASGLPPPRCTLPMRGMSYPKSLGAHLPIEYLHCSCIGLELHCVVLGDWRGKIAAGIVHLAAVAAARCLLPYMRKEWIWQRFAYQTQAPRNSTPTLLRLWMEASVLGALRALHARIRRDMGHQGCLELFSGVFRTSGILSLSLSKILW